MTDTRDYRGAIIITSSTLGGAVTGLVLPVLLMRLAWLVFGESDALGQGFLLIAASLFFVPFLAYLAGRTAYKIRQKQRPGPLTSGFTQS